MDQFDLDHLQQLLTETKEKQAAFPFCPPDETGCQITYLPSKLRIYWPGRIDSPNFLYEMEKAGVAERPKLRKGTQNYFRFVRKDGKLLRVDTFISGRLDVILLAHYDGDRRYCFPFSDEGGVYYTYVDVVRFRDGRAVEDYMVRGSQIVYRAYDYSDPERIGYREINYVPTGNEPIICKSIGYFEQADKLRYVETDGWTFWDGPET